MKKLFLNLTLCLAIFTFSTAEADEVVVKFKNGTPAESIQRFTQTHHLVLISYLAFSPGTFVFKSQEPTSNNFLLAIQQAPIVDHAYKPRKRFRETRAIDPYFAQQWHLDNQGQSGGCSGDDLNLQFVSEKGQNVVIAIVDDGLEIAHPDLVARTQAMSPYHYDYVSNDNNPTAGDHGTAVGGVAAATADNGIGGQGVAPLADLMGVRLLGSAISDLDEANALGHYPQIIDISNNSWGVPEDSVYLDGFGVLARAAVANGVENGRNGLGINYVWAGGNGGPNSNANWDGYANSPYVIAVAATDDCGEATYYSEPGANILLNAPSSSVYSTIFTTDRTGSDGYNNGVNSVGEPSDADYTATFGGTSAAAPMVSGVIARMLDANPQLTWRDVRRILVETAYQNDPTHPAWQKNAANFWFNPYYGFGRVDTLAAVTAAKNWFFGIQSVKVEKTASLTPALQIPEIGEPPLLDSLQVTESMVLEDVSLSLSSNHRDWSDLTVKLTSPSGTQTILSEGEQGGFLINTENSWTFLSMAFYGEPSAGDWVLEVSDQDAGLRGDLQAWSLILNGIAEVTGRGDIAPLGAPDGKVDIADALVVLRVALQLVELSDSSQIEIVDLVPEANPDGVITIGDALKVLRIALRLDV